MMTKPVAVITGGAKGIGLACAKLFSAQGYRVALLDADALALQAASETLSADDWRPITADVSSSVAIDEAVATIKDAWGRIDVLVNNAGIAFASALSDHSDADWNRVFAVNVNSAFFMCRATVPLLQAQGGAIVNVSSMTAMVGQPRGVAYTASKGALLAMTKALALELAPHNIRVNCVCPAGVDTPLMQSWAGSQADPQAVLKAQADMHVLGRMASPEEIANAIYFLATPSSSFITGVILPVEGGATLGYRRT